MAGVCTLRWKCIVCKSLPETVEYLDKQETQKAQNYIDGWMNQADSRLSTTHGHITDCKLLVCMYWTRLVLVRPAASIYSAIPLKHHPTCKQ